MGQRQQPFKNTLQLSCKETTLSEMCRLYGGVVGGLQLLSLSVTKDGENIRKQKFSGSIIDKYMEREVLSVLHLKRPNSSQWLESLDTLMKKSAGLCLRTSHFSRWYRAALENVITHNLKWRKGDLLLSWYFKRILRAQIWNTVLREVKRGKFFKSLRYI